MSRPRDCCWGEIELLCLGHRLEEDDVRGVGGDIQLEFDGPAHRDALDLAGAAALHRHTHSAVPGPEDFGPKVIAVASAAAQKRKRRRVTTRVPSASYTLAAGRSMTVHLRLNRTGRRLLARFHKLPVKVTVTQVGKPKPISTRKLTIHLRKPKHHSH